MTLPSDAQWGRRASLYVIRPAVQASSGNNPSAAVQARPEETLDLSDLHFTFRTTQADEQSPSTCIIRVFNLASTEKQNTVRNIIKGEYSRVVVQAGYQDNFGIVFDGTIRQYRVGRLNATDTFLDILAADGDIAYNFAVVKTTLGAGSTPRQAIDTVVASMQNYGVGLGFVGPMASGTLPRGKVLFGMARTYLRSIAQTNGATWSIQDGKINIVPLTGYLPGEAVELNAMTGLIGRAEQTPEGVCARCLINPKLGPGSLVRINNASINQAIVPTGVNEFAAPLQWTGIQLRASVTEDGLYRVYVCEHEGDTRGQAWCTNLVCLAVNPDTLKVNPYG